MRIANRTVVLARPEPDADVGSLQRTRQAQAPLLVRAPTCLPVRSGYKRAPRYAPALLIVAIVAVMVMMIAGARHIDGAAGDQGHHTYCK